MPSEGKVNAIIVDCFVIHTMTSSQALSKKGGPLYAGTESSISGPAAVVFRSTRESKTGWGSPGHSLGSRTPALGGPASGQTTQERECDDAYGVRTVDIAKKKSSAKALRGIKSKLKPRKERPGPKYREL